MMRKYQVRFGGGSVEKCLRRQLATFLPYLTQLARDVLDGAKLSDLQTLFADDLQVSHNPMGSLTTPSAVIIPGPKVMTWDDWVSQKTVVVRRTRRKEVVPEGQMGFGI